MIKNTKRKISMGNECMGEIKNINSKKVLSENKYLKFKFFLIHNGITEKEIAKLLHISPSTLSKKINRNINSDFSMDEVIKICTKYNLSSSIFCK